MRTYDPAAEFAEFGAEFGKRFEAEVGQAAGTLNSLGFDSTSIGIEEPALFSEPGVFLVRADGTLYFASVQTMPFVRPHFKEMVGALDFVKAKDYPARGEYTGAV